jgi:hypothetical protein
LACRRADRRARRSARPGWPVLPAASSREGLWAHPRPLHTGICCMAAGAAGRHARREGRIGWPPRSAVCVRFCRAPGGEEVSLWRFSWGVFEWRFALFPKRPLHQKTTNWLAQPENGRRVCLEGGGGGAAASPLEAQPALRRRYPQWPKPVGFIRPDVGRWSFFERLSCVLTTFRGLYSLLLRTYVPCMWQW